MERILEDEGVYGELTQVQYLLPNGPAGNLMLLLVAGIDIKCGFKWRRVSKFVKVEGSEVLFDLSDLH